MSQIIKSKKTLVFAHNVTEVMGDRRMTDQEKTGHLRALIVAKKEDDVVKLEALLKWLLKTETLPPFWGQFDQSSRIFLISYDPETYFKWGGKEVLTRIVREMGSRGWPMVSHRGADYWVGYFPHIKVVALPETPEVTEEKASFDSGFVEIKEIPIKAKEVEVPAFKAKVVRNRKRKEVPAFTNVEDEDGIGWE